MLYFVACDGADRDVHVLTHASPTRRSSDLLGADINRPARTPTANARSQISCTTAGSTPGNKSRASFRGVPTVSNCAARIRPARYGPDDTARPADRKSTRLNSSH